MYEGPGAAFRSLVVVGGRPEEEPVTKIPLKPSNQSHLTRGLGVRCFGFMV